MFASLTLDEVIGIEYILVNANTSIVRELSYGLTVEQRSDYLALIADNTAIRQDMPTHVSESRGGFGAPYHWHTSRVVRFADARWHLDLIDENLG